jgi:hypothetical protein
MQMFETGLPCPSVTVPLMLPLGASSATLMLVTAAPAATGIHVASFRLRALM